MFLIRNVMNISHRQEKQFNNGMGGDCDDHTILMVSALKAIGAHCRMVLTEGHLYPELLCGDEKAFEVMQSAIILLIWKRSDRQYLLP